MEAERLGHRVAERNPSLRQLEAWLPINRLAIHQAQTTLGTRPGFHYEKPPEALTQPKGFQNPVRDGTNRLVGVNSKAEPARRDGKRQPTTAIIPAPVAARLPRGAGKRGGKHTVLIVLAWAREQLLASEVAVADDLIAARLGLSERQVQRVRLGLTSSGVLVRSKHGFVVQGCPVGKVSFDVALTPRLRRLPGVPNLAAASGAQANAITTLARKLGPELVAEAVTDALKAEMHADSGATLHASHLLDALEVRSVEKAPKYATGHPFDTRLDTESLIDNRSSREGEPSNHPLSYSAVSYSVTAPASPRRDDEEDRKEIGVDPEPLGRAKEEQACEGEEQQTIRSAEAAAAQIARGLVAQARPELRRLFGHYAEPGRQIEKLIVEAVVLLHRRVGIEPEAHRPVIEHALKEQLVHVSLAPSQQQRFAALKRALGFIVDSPEMRRRLDAALPRDDELFALLTQRADEALAR